MTFRRLLVGLGLAALTLLAGCEQLSRLGLPVGVPTPTPIHAVTPTQPSFIPPGNSVDPLSPVPTAEARLTLQLWLPPEFDPAGGTPAGDILRTRLDQYQARRPNVTVELRLKTPDGAGGMLNTLTAASAAAPLALPDVLALPRRLIEPAVQKGLVYPFEPLEPIADLEWFPFAAEFGSLQSGYYNLPFAGDALVMLARSSLVAAPPASWDALLQADSALLFPAAEPDALFTVAQYQAAGGALQDTDGRPNLNEEILASVYGFFQRASTAEQMPFWLTQYETDAQVWQAYVEQRAPLAITWLSNYFQAHPANTGVFLPPTRDGSPHTLASGWGWVLPNPDPQRRMAAAELALFLSDTDFLAAWTEAAGYLPTRPDVLHAWKNDQARLLAQNFIDVAFPYPSSAVLGIVGPALQEGTVNILKQQESPVSAARTAVGRVNAP